MDGELMGLGVAATAALTDAVGATGSHESRHASLGLHAESYGAITPEMAAACIWDDRMVGGCPAVVRDVPFVSVGGGLGSFAMADMLRIAGMPASDIAVVGPFAESYTILKLLLDASQIPEGTRIRSGSLDRMDNIWGWPGYAMEEAFACRTPAPLWHSVTEPVLSDYFTPKASQVYRGIDREAERISWNEMVIRGRVPFVRKREKGGYFVVIVPPDGESVRDVEILRAEHLHLAVGFTAARCLPGLTAYRASGADPSKVSNVYEPHEHIYEALVEAPGSVLIRGSASSSMQVFQRLVEDRDAHGASTQIYQQFRSYIDSPHGPPMFRIPGGDGFAYQAFTFAKGAYGGQLHRRWGSLTSHDERAELLAKLASTAIPRRRNWVKQVRRGKKEGWYHAVVGSAERLEPTDDGRVRAYVDGPDEEVTAVEVDFVIDATGAEATLADHEILSDLVDCSGAAVNGFGQLDVDEAFAVGGAGSGRGRVYATGVSVFGNRHTIPMYGFWGVQYSAWKTAEDLARLGFCPHLGFRRSVTGWWRRMRNSPP